MQRVFQSPVRGIGALTANGNNGVFAFSEHKLSPSIFVYTFPEFQLKNELKGKMTLSPSCDFYLNLCNCHIIPTGRCCFLSVLEE